MFNQGDCVEFVDYPTIKGVVRGILPALEDLPEEVSVDMFIPTGEPGFQFTGITENFLCAPGDLRANTGLQADLREACRTSVPCCSCVVRETCNHNRVFPQAAKD